MPEHEDGTGRSAFLVVEDDRLVARAIEREFARADPASAVTVASSVPEGLQRARPPNRWHAVVIDMCLPEDAAV